MYQYEVMNDWSYILYFRVSNSYKILDDSDFSYTVTISLSQQPKHLTSVLLYWAFIVLDKMHTQEKWNLFKKWLWPLTLTQLSFWLKKAVNLKKNLDLYQLRFMSPTNIPQLISNTKWKITLIWRILIDLFNLTEAFITCHLKNNWRFLLRLRRQQCLKR